VLAGIGRYRAGETAPQRGAIVDIGFPHGCSPAATECYPETESILLRVGLDGHIACFRSGEYAHTDTLPDGRYFTLDTNATQEDAATHAVLWLRSRDGHLRRRIRDDWPLGEVPGRLVGIDIHELPTPRTDNSARECGP
jgi:hypothetical protein